MTITTSRTPWTTRHNNNSADVLDADGNVIGQFFDWRDADWVCEHAEIRKMLDEALLENEELDEANDELQKEIEKLKQSAKANSQQSNP